MHNVRPFRTLLPVARRDKVTHFQECAVSLQLLLPTKEYILLKRFTAKEEKRRTVVGILRTADFPVKRIAIENHLNYLHRPKEEMTPEELFGLAALLNSALIDCYFRQINGNTQVCWRRRDGQTGRRFGDPHFMDKTVASRLSH